MIPEESHISTYPVGVLQMLLGRRPAKSTFGYIAYQIKARNWRAVRNSFNGYLAEWHYPPEGMIVHRAGKGWTRRAAIRRLGIHIAEVNSPELNTTKREQK